MNEIYEGMRASLAQRFGEEVPAMPAGQGPDRWPQSCPETWHRLAARGSCRRFSERPVAPELIETLCALALCAPTKSDLQQRDIVIAEEPARARIDELLSTGPLAQDWIPGAPALLVFCGNNRRQRQLHQWRGKPFANDHLDAFFNAAVDAGIALSACVLAAEAAGLGCACISAIRNHAREVSELLGLPEHVFPVAGLGLGWPAHEAHVSLRLPLSATVHHGRFEEADIRATVDAYDRRRAAAQPVRTQRATALFGTADFYGWSEDKARQYARPERADWGAFVRGKGFRLD
jgi:nitroreductase/FMN reductase [NAD(P)H]